MKQIEITVRLNENMQSAIRKLEMQGFKKIRESEIDEKGDDISKKAFELILNKYFKKFDK